MPLAPFLDELYASSEIKYEHCGGAYRVCRCPAKQFCQYAMCWANGDDVCPLGKECTMFATCPAIKDPVEYCQLPPDAFFILQPLPYIRGEFVYEWDLVWTYYPELGRSFLAVELRMDHMWSIPEAPLSDDWYDEYKVDAIREENRRLGTLDAAGDSDDEESSDMEAPINEHIETTAAAPELPVTPPSGEDAAVDGSADEEDEMATHL